MKQIAALTSSMKGRVMVNAGAKPYISVKIEKNASPLDLLREVLGYAKEGLEAGAPSPSSAADPVNLSGSPSCGK